MAYRWLQTTLFLWVGLILHAQGIISTVAGTGNTGNSGNGGPATSAALGFPAGVVVDQAGNIYIADSLFSVVRKVNSAGIISTFAGGGGPASLGDGGPATSARLAFLATKQIGLALDAAGNLYIADTGDSRIRKVDTSGNISTVAGSSASLGVGSFSGDGGPATSAGLNSPVGVALDSAGNLYIADYGNLRIRKVDTSGTITTFAGIGNPGGSDAGDGGPATSAQLSGISDVAVDSKGNVYIADQEHVRKVNSAGIISTAAHGFFGTCSQTPTPVAGSDVAAAGLAVDGAGNLYMADHTGSCIQELTTGGLVITVAGGGTVTGGDGGLATNVNLGDPNAVALDASGNIYIAVGSVIRKVTVPAAGSPYVCTNTSPPAITSIDSASAYGGYSYFASGSWLEIKGINLADPLDPRLTAATNPGQWTAADFSGSNAPTTLDGISVSINGKPAYVWYLSPAQINVQAPEDTTMGNIGVTITNCKATSGPFPMARQALAPGFLAPPNYTANGTQYMVATFASDGAYVLNTSTGAAFGLKSRPAKPGDTIVAYGIGFGDVTPSILPGVIAGQSNSLVNPVAISFGSTKATLTYWGLAGNFVGLYEFYITVPSGLANGDYQINATQNGATVPQTMYLTVHN